MNSPMPMDNDFLIVAGMASIIASRKFVRVSNNRIIPSIRTAVRANCQEYPIPRQIANTKNALEPIPGAIPNGIFATKASSSVPIMDIRAVVVNIAPWGMPSEENICGFTANIYDIVRNDVIPAKISVLTVDFC